jgi:glycosyltransferase involved in cell wall biosynthesis
LKLLIVSWYFPPVNTIGALRVGKFARFLIERGHDLAVVAGSRWGPPETLPLGASLERVVHAGWADVNAPLRLAQRRSGRAPGKDAPAAAVVPPELGSAAAGAAGPSLRRRLGGFYVNLTNLPDSRIGWFPGAYGGARRLCRDWRPDLIFASGPPFTALLAGRALSARLRRPWVAELRDRWADDPYEELPPWRAAIDHWLERRILRSAAALVTVTEPWAASYRRKYDKPVATIYNGYDPLDFDGPETGALPSPPRPHMVIGYTGGIYPGRRDPSPLFAALRLLGTDAERIRIIFCGTEPRHVLPLAESAGVAHLVELRDSVPYRQSLAFQRQSDVLLLMQWNDPREQGNCPGKFFEYIASLRPVLLLGLEDGVPATILRQRSAGWCLNDPPAIAAQLRRWLDEKDKLGRVTPLSPSAREGLSRTIQYEKLERFLLTILERRGAGNSTPADDSVLEGA